jgi:hypothetical protein
MNTDGVAGALAKRALYIGLSPKQKAKIQKLGLNSLSLGLLFWAQANINAFGAGNTSTALN